MEKKKSVYVLSRLSSPCPGDAFDDEDLSRPAAYQRQCQARSSHYKKYGLLQPKKTFSSYTWRPLVTVFVPVRMVPQSTQISLDDGRPRDSTHRDFAYQHQWMLLCKCKECKGSPFFNMPPQRTPANELHRRLDLHAHHNSTAPDSKAHVYIAVSAYHGSRDQTRDYPLRMFAHPNHVQLNFDATSMSLRGSGGVRRTTAGCSWYIFSPGNGKMVVRTPTGDIDGSYNLHEMGDFRPSWEQEIANPFAGTSTVPVNRGEKKGKVKESYNTFHPLRPDRVRRAALLVRSLRAMYLSLLTVRGGSLRLSDPVIILILQFLYHPGPPELTLIRQPYVVLHQKKLPSLVQKELLHCLSREVRRCLCTTPPNPWWRTLTTFPQNLQQRAGNSQPPLWPAAWKQENNEECSRFVKRMVNGYDPHLTAFLHEQLLYCENTLVSEEKDQKIQLCSDALDEMVLTDVQTLGGTERLQDQSIASIDTMRNHLLLHQDGWSNRRGGGGGIMRRDFFALMNREMGSSESWKNAVSNITHAAGQECIYRFCNRDIQDKI